MSVFSTDTSIVVVHKVHLNGGWNYKRVNQINTQLQSEDFHKWTQGEHIFGLYAWRDSEKCPQIPPS